MKAGVSHGDKQLVLSRAEAFVGGMCLAGHGMKGYGYGVQHEAFEDVSLAACNEFRSLS